MSFAFGGMSMKKSLVVLGVLSAAWAFAAEPAATAVISVDPAKALGPIRDMHSVNGGPKVAPVGGDQKSGNFEVYRAARIPFARTHDCIECVSGGPHTCDISAIFPNFDADENDPKSYDFVFTDYYLDNMIRAGTKPFFRLGQTIEHGPKKYGVLPPKDFAKWARVCEHVIRHYNEGWGWATDRAYTTRNLAWSNQFDIVYWEIWNEPDLDPSDDPNALPKGPRCWGGTVTNFFRLYETTAKHLKGKFPNLRIGGPAICGNFGWGRRFLCYCRDNKVPLDFFSWHCYATDPRQVADRCRAARKMMDECGFAGVESILNEWNYVKGWVDDWVYSLEVERGRFNQKSAAFVAATMIDCQSAPLDHLMYYDARPVGMNGLFDYTTLEPMKGYYPFYAWSRLVDCGTQVACTVSEGRGKKVDAATGITFEKPASVQKGGFHAVAAKGADGSSALFVARYSDDNNVTDTATAYLRLPGLEDARRARCHVTDAVRTYTEVPLVRADDGSYIVRLQPNSFALVEW